MSGIGEGSPLPDDAAMAWGLVGFGFPDTDNKALNWYVRAVRGGR